LGENLELDDALFLLEKVRREGGREGEREREEEDDAQPNSLAFTWEKI